MGATIALDCGNGDVKFYNGTPQGKDFFPHAMIEIGEAKWDSVRKRSRGAMPRDYIRVNGKPYAIGTTAEGYPEMRQMFGAERYTPEYYGVLFCGVLSRLYTRSTAVTVFGSHPPGDLEYRNSLIDAVIGSRGKWEVEYSSGAEEAKKRTFTVEYVNAYDEGHGGAMNVFLDKTGVKYKNDKAKKSSKGNSLVFDIGAKTTDLLGVLPDGEIDYSVADSFDVGIRNVLKTFKSAIRHTYREDALFKSHTEDQMRPANVREALSTGVYRAGGRPFECHDEVEESTGILMSQIRSAYFSGAGGPGRWDTIILTGGGAWFVYDKLLQILQHGNVQLAADNLDDLRFANVEGGLKLWKLWKALGWFDGE